MKSQFISTLAEGASVDSTFAMRSKEMRATRAGDAYLAIELSDRTGVIPAVWFRPDATAAMVPAGSVVRVSGRITSYRGSKRVSVQSLVPARRYDPADMIASGPGDKDGAVSQFREIAGTVRDTELRRALKAVFGDAEFFERFTACPGSQTRHHAYLGGLVSHSVAVAGICDTLASLYVQVDRDLLVTAALLHDMGKVDELRWDTGIEFTDEGRLVGHVVLGERRFRRAVDRLRTPLRPALLARLSHAILSHHGELEWGSPKRPSTLEALLLHHADNLDAKATGFTELLSSASSVDERWTDAQNMFRRPLYAPAAAETDRAARVEEDQQYVTASA